MKRVEWWRIKWACRLTNNSVDAEDLLQDCFVAFVTTNRDQLIEILTGIFAVCSHTCWRARNMDARFNLCQIEEAYEIESGMNVLAEIEERERQYALRRQVRLIYNFAKRRNNPVGRTKAGKIFIFRLYESKSGREVAQLTGSSRGAVDQWVRIAHLEIQSVTKSTLTNLLGSFIESPLYS